MYLFERKFTPKRQLFQQSVFDLPAIDTATIVKNDDCLFSASFFLCLSNHLHASLSVCMLYTCVLIVSSSCPFHIFKINSVVFLNCQMGVMPLMQPSLINLYSHFLDCILAKYKTHHKIRLARKDKLMGT